jgi:DNA-binding NarL/FixJ family response regulator
MSKPIRVLIVDDDTSFREALAFLISDVPGVELAGEARNGREMLEVALAVHPDVVLTDVNMPILDGIEATRLLKSTPKPPMVVVCSGAYGTEVSTAAFAAGADAFIKKRELCERVPSLLAPGATVRAASFRGHPVPSRSKESKQIEPVDR